MLVKFFLPETPEYPSGKEVWLHAEDIDRVEGHSDWKMKKTTVYLKRNPTEPFLIINKAIVNALEPIDKALDRFSDDIQSLTRAVERLVEELAMARGGNQ